MNELFCYFQTLPRPERFILLLQLYGMAVSEVDRLGAIVANNWSKETSAIQHNHADLARKVLRQLCMDAGIQPSDNQKESEEKSDEPA